MAAARFPNGLVPEQRIRWTVDGLSCRGSRARSAVFLPANTSGTDFVFSPNYVPELFVSRLPVNTLAGVCWFCTCRSSV